ncbi:MAG: LysR substrate-binding domain-containing protein [Sedimentitalea sp.]
MRNLPPLNALRAFEAAGRHQSFSLAAQELNVSHSAISRHVRGLEDRLGCQLFRDLPRGVTLTQDGLVYLARVSPALDAIAQATEGLSETPAGRLTINSEPLFASKVLIPMLGDFQRAFPDVDVRLEASQSLADVERYEADLAVRFRGLGLDDGPSDLISDAPLFVFAAPELVKAAQLSPHQMLAQRRFRDRSPDVWRMWFDAVGMPDVSDPSPNWRLRANLAYEAALHGHGVYLGSSDCTAQDMKAGRLKIVHPVGVRHGAFHLVYGSRGPRSAAARQFRLWLLDRTAGFRGAPLEFENQPYG